jgi:hypothetical protein
MGKLYEGIDERVRAFIEAQHMFFVATAPAAVDGHVNLSPKGLDSFAVLGPREVAYLDLVGSGAETIAHLRENGRITLMFCAFEGPPKILRLYGRGAYIEPPDGVFADMRARFELPTPARGIVRVTVERIADSCGFGVPLYQFEGERSQLLDSAARKGESGLREYQQVHNRASIDGLPALRWAEAT